MAHSAEEEVARDFLCFGGADGAVVVCDATCLERNLNLVLQTLEITPRTVVCVNLMDEARSKGIEVDTVELSRLLGVPVVAVVGDIQRTAALTMKKLVIRPQHFLPIVERTFQSHTASLLLFSIPQVLPCFKQQIP